MTQDEACTLHPAWCSPSDSVLEGLARLTSFLPGDSAVLIAGSSRAAEKTGVKAAAHAGWEHGDRSGLHSRQQIHSSRKCSK